MVSCAPHGRPPPRTLPPSQRFAQATRRSSRALSRSISQASSALRARGSAAPPQPTRWCRTPGSRTAVPRALRGSLEPPDMALRHPRQRGACSQKVSHATRSHRLPRRRERRGRTCGSPRKLQPEGHRWAGHWAASPGAVSTPDMASNEPICARFSSVPSRTYRRLNRRSSYCRMWRS